MQELDPHHDEVDDLASWHGEITRWDLYLSFSHQSSQVRDVEPEKCINSPRLATIYGPRNTLNPSSCIDQRKAQRQILKSATIHRYIIVIKDWRNQS